MGNRNKEQEFIVMYPSGKRTVVSETKVIYFYHMIKTGEIIEEIVIFPKGHFDGDSYKFAYKILITTGNYDKIGYMNVNDVMVRYLPDYNWIVT